MQNSVVPTFFLLFAMCCPPSTYCKSNKQPPNVIFIVADDLGWNDVSFHGSNQIPTPNIDKLANSGVILNNYYVQPLCTPSRSAIMTGRYPIHTGMQTSVILSDRAWGLSPNFKIMPQYLKSLGYKTHAVGKWHLGFFAKEYLPSRRGFDSFYGYYCGKGDYWDHSEASELYWGLDLHDNEKPVWNQWGNYSSDMFSEIAIERIQRHNKETPLFLYLAYQAVHSANTNHDPIQAPNNWINKFKHIENEQRRKFAAVTAAMDYGIGRVYEELQKSGMADNTVIIFTTDNGGPANGFDMNYASNFPLRGVKATLWEGGVRGTSFVHSKLIQSPGRVSKELFHITDWLPTIYRLAGGDASALPGLDGIDIWDAISKEKTPSPRTEILLNIDPHFHHNSALRVGDYKIINAHGGYWSGWFAPPSVTYIEDEDGFTGHQNAVVKCGPAPTNATDCSQAHGGTCLFNIKTDPCEYHNLAGEMPELLNEMLLKLEKYSKTMIKPRNNSTVDPLADPKLHAGVWEPWL